MNYSTLRSSLLACTILVSTTSVWAGQAPGGASAPDIPVSHRDRVYAAEQFSNTVSVTDPVDNKLLGVIRLGDPQPGNFSPLYKGQVLVHGLGFSPDGRTLAGVGQRVWPESPGELLALACSPWSLSPHPAGGALRPPLCAGPAVEQAPAGGAG